MQFGSNGMVRLLTVRFTVNELFRINGSVHKFMVQFGYFRFGLAVWFDSWSYMNSPSQINESSKLIVKDAHDSAINNCNTKHEITSYSIHF
jgi:hypothetical protein